MCGLGQILNEASDLENSVGILKIQPIFLFGLLIKNVGQKSAQPDHPSDVSATEGNRLQGLGDMQQEKKDLLMN